MKTVPGLLPELRTAAALLEVKPIFPLSSCLRISQESVAMPGEPTA
jgi:hypothetical protein